MGHTQAETKRKKGSVHLNKRKVKKKGRRQYREVKVQKHSKTPRQVPLHTGDVKNPQTILRIDTHTYIYKYTF
jgi:hypothetical protein